jgi:type II secretory pathway component GspD/PulD (secretin)
MVSRFGIICLVLIAVAAGPCHALVYCSITGIETGQLSNGVQITVKADGILERNYEVPHEFGGALLSRMDIGFSNARNQTGRNFIDISQFPVSHIELSLPSWAKEGTGVLLSVVMYEPSQVTVTGSSDRQSYIITVSSSRTLEQRQKSTSEKSGEQATDIQVEAVDGVVSVMAVKADLYDMLGRIAQKTNANITVDDAIGQQVKEVNLNLRTLPVRDLLRAIASAYGLALSERDGVYMFSWGVPQDLAAYLLSGTESFPLRYTTAKAASGLLPTFLYSYLHVNESQNAVVVTAPQQMLDKIGADLRAVDIAPPQILIEALACEFTDTADLDKVLRAFRGDVIGKATMDLEDDDESNDTGGLPEFSGTLDTRSGTISYSNLGELPNDFEARLRVLETEHRARVRAAPRMAVINGHQADIFIGTRRFIKVLLITFGQSTEKVQGIDVGVKLRVTPLTGGGGEITLKIDDKGTEVSNISEVDPQTGLPVLSTRQAGTTVRVKDHETVMIGGLSQRQTEDRITKIPVLGDLPLIGGLFRSRNRSTVNSDLVVFITPHILTPEGRLGDAEERQMRERFGVPEAGR